MISSPSPRSGEDSYDIVDDALTALAERRGLWLGDDITAIALITSLIQQAQQFLPHLVHDARASGCSWQQIGRALGTSPDDARLRYDPDSPLADGRWPYELSVASEGRPGRGLSGR